MKFLFANLLAVTLLFSWSGPLAAQAPESRPIAEIYAEAMTAFQNSDYKTTVANLEKVIAGAAPDAQLESVYFTLAAGYFNLPDYPKAIVAFKAFQTKFPKAPRINDAALGIAQSLFLSGDFVNAAAQFKALEAVPELREQVLTAQANALQKSGKLDEAIATLERLVLPEIKTEVAADGAILLTSWYAEKGLPEKAAPMLGLIQKNIALVQNVVQLNSLAIKLGDDFLLAGSNQEALASYRAARNPNEVIRFQVNRLAAMQKQLDQNLAAMRANPAAAAPLVSANNQLRTKIADASKLLEDFKKLPDFSPALLFRIARTYDAMGRKWESIVVYREIISRYTSSTEKESALFGVITAYAEVNRPTRASEFCDQYLKEFPQGANLETVSYLKGVMALQSNDPASAEALFGRLLKEQPTGKFREEMMYQVGNARFQQGKYAEAATQYQDYQTEFPSGSHTEEIAYRSALTLLFAGNYEDALPALNNYLQRYPSGELSSDAKYRIAVCKYAAQQYDQVIADCEQWEKTFPENVQLGEVLALRGDALVALDRTDDALPIYIRSYKVATTDDVLNYSLFEANKILTKKGDWDKVSTMFEEFVKERPDHPSAVTAIYWIGRARAREGKAEEAKKFIADTIKKYIDDPDRSSVELLLTQLAQLCAKKRTPVTVDAAPAEKSPAMELDELLDASRKDATPTARARILFAQSELARLRRQIPEQEKQFQAIADGTDPTALSPMLLAQIGDYLLAKKQSAKAGEYYQRLMDAFPKSDQLDYAYTGLGELAYEKGDYPVALRYFSDTVEKIGATTKLKEATLGQAKTLMALGRDAEAQKLFEQVAATREWRGDATAFSVYSLGEIAFRQGKFAEANAFFQRVFVAYQRFLPWVAKAYLKSGESFEKLGKNQEAINTYREMERNQKLAAFSELTAARQRLKELGAG